MTEIELEKIHRGKGDVIEHEKAPIKKILSNSVMLAVWLSAFGELMMSQFIVMYGPTFLKEVISKKDMKKLTRINTGAGIRCQSHWIFCCRTAFPSFMFQDYLRNRKWPHSFPLRENQNENIQHNCTHGKKLNFQQFVSRWLQVSGAFFCILGYLPKEHANYSLVALLIIECSTGFICGGFYKCATLVARLVIISCKAHEATLMSYRQHSHFVLSQIQFIKCLSLFIEPLLVFLICTHNTLEEWRIVFLTHGFLLISKFIIWLKIHNNFSRQHNFLLFRYRRACRFHSSSNWRRNDWRRTGAQKVVELSYYMFWMSVYLWFLKLS